MYLEETELEYRVTKLKYKIYNVPSARIIHFEGKSLPNSFDRDRRLENSYDIYFKKALKPTSIMIRSFLTVLNIKLRLLIFTFFGNKKKLSFWANRYSEINTRIIVRNNE
jgi:GT2 family glycosyltransferase